MKKVKKQTTFREDAGKALLDLGKLVFGGIFIGGILRGEFPHYLLITGGFVVAFMFIIMGLLLGTKEKKDTTNTN
ncbi:MAG: hypothetical protein LBH20_11740 [Treponema sp.]|jgi:uncharacterized membrane protein YraQ (UPF0718 family)|nr:hypothetical protein [Treponema sp.]